MAELRPYPFAALIRRMFAELEAKDAVFDLPRAKFFGGEGARDLGVRFHDQRAGTPLGPAAGPQSQMAQNVVLSWLAGCRVMELKTVQINDELEIPRPCIDMQTVGYNVEWSQELKLEQSLEEYVKGAMLVEMLRASGRVPTALPGDGVLYDMSVGYDLAGIRSERVQAFVRGMLDCGEVVGRLRAEIPSEFAELRELDFPTRLSRTLTLSTFHGCPPQEIESIIEYLLEMVGLHCIVKLNPMLLGPRDARGLLGETLGYEELRIPDSAFERDTSWDQMEGFVERLGDRARALGLGFGVKFSNTLIVENHRDFFPDEEREMYLSGRPLHVLAMNLVQRFRARFGDRYPISFSAGIERKNFPDAVALGLVPITVCSDLLKPGGYGRAKGYLDELQARMEAVDAATIDQFVLRAYGQEAAAIASLDLDPGTGPEALSNDEHARLLSAARLLNTEHYVPRATVNPLYAAANNRKPPKKIGSHLELFDCITCDKCVPVCPNDANFTFALPAMELPILKVTRAGDGWTSRTDGTLVIEEKHQLANFADFCNECGNCDVFCPEDGGPYVIKPRFFGTRADWQEFDSLDGFHLERRGELDELVGRFGGVEYRATFEGPVARYSGDGFEVTLEPADPFGTLSGTASCEVDLTYFRILELLREAVYGHEAFGYPKFAAAEG